MSIGWPQDLIPNPSFNWQYKCKTITRVSAMISEDIEVPELSSPSDNPPRYEDLVEQDNTEGKSRHTNPIKSIIKKSDKNKPRRSDTNTDKDVGSVNLRHSLSVLSEESYTNMDLSLITVHMTEGDTPPRRQGKEITLDMLSHRQRADTAHVHKRSCGFPDKSCCCAPTTLGEKSSDSYVALVDGKSGNGLTKRACDGDSRGPETMNTQL